MTKYRRAILWVVVNAAALPFASWAMFMIVFGSVAGVTFNGPDLKTAIIWIPFVMMLGAICGVLLGLVQGWALGSYGVKILVWTLATTAGVSLDVGVAYGVGVIMASRAPSPSGFVGEFVINSVVWLLVFTHGCTLAAVQWLALRRSERHIAAWLWLAGVTWSLLTPYPFAFLMEFTDQFEPNTTNVFVAFLLPLLLALPYILVTTYLLERYSPPVPPKIEWRSRFALPPAVPKQPDDQQGSQEAS